MGGWVARRKMSDTKDYSCPTDLIDGEGVFTFEFGSILCGFGRQSFFFSSWNPEHKNFGKTLLVVPKMTDADWNKNFLTIAQAFVSSRKVRYNSKVGVQSGSQTNLLIFWQHAFCSILINIMQPRMPHGSLRDMRSTSCAIRKMSPRGTSSSQFKYC